MKFPSDSKYLKISLYTIFVVVTCILAYRLSSKTDNIIPNITDFVKSIISILSPIIYGLLIAYLLNPVMSFFERPIVRYAKACHPKHFRRIRLLSITIVYVLLFGTVFLVIKFLLPQILSNIRVLLNNMPDYARNLKGFAQDLQAEINTYLSTFGVQISSEKAASLFDFNRFLNISTIDINSVNGFLDKFISSSLNFTGVLLDWTIGFVIALYALQQKEFFANGSKRLTFAIFKEVTAKKVVSLFSETHEMVIKFFVGKSLDSLIIGILCYIGLSLMDNPYALLLALIIGVCNMIPYFGPFIGAVPAIALTLFEGINPAIWVAVFILFLQQFDGLVLGPKILGDSIGISPFWIISAITIGGALWGPLGMFFASPILAVILHSVNRWINKRLHEKEILMPQLVPSNFNPHFTKTNYPLHFPKIKRKQQKPKK